MTTDTNTKLFQRDAKKKHREKNTADAQRPQKWI